MSLKPKDLGDWITVIVGVVAIVGSLGGMYVSTEKFKTEASARLYNLEMRVDSREGLNDKVTRLEEQRKNDKENQEDLRRTLKELSNNVSSLTVVLARLQGKEKGGQ